MNRLARIAGTLALALAAALAFAALHTPLPWMLGPLLTCAAVTMLGAPTATHRALRNAGQWAIGTSLGLYFTPAVVAVLPRLLPAIAVGVVWALLMGYGFYRLLWWRHGGDPAVNRATAFFSGSIGGASEMALLAERHHGRVDLVAAGHSLRVMLVVATIPFALKAIDVHGADAVLPSITEVRPDGLAVLVAATLAAVALASRLGLPNPWVLGALLTTMAITAFGGQLSALPRAAINAGQLFIGVSLGTRFTPAFARSAPRWMVTVVIGTLGMIVASALFGAAMALVIGQHPATLVLATSPGGIAEMSITAKVLQLGVPVVTAFHVVRYLAVLMLTQRVYRWELRRVGEPVN